MPEVVGRPLEVGDVEIEPAVVVIISERNAHGRHHSSLGGQGHATHNSDLFERSIALVMVEIGIEAIVGNEQIRPAVVVIVGGPDGKILALRLIDLRAGSHIGEGAVTIVVIERVWTAPVNTGSTTAKHTS